MRARTLIVLIVAFVTAGGTAMFARSWLEAQRAAMAASIPKPAPAAVTAEILVAREALPAGTILKPAHLRWQPWPDDGVAAHYMAKGRSKPEDLAGAVVRQGLTAGEPITENRVVRPGDRGFLAAMLSPGMRAVTLSLNAMTGIAGFVFPGDYVDIILTHTTSPNDKDGVARRASETVLHKVRVLAIDQRTENPEGKPAVPKTATVEVDAKQAEIIAVAGEMGQLSLSLRSLAAVDDDAAPVNGAAARRSYTLDNEVSTLLRRPAASGPAASHAVSVVRGAKVEAVDFGTSPPVERPKGQ
ncbi:MAG: Flp pilus assembly protein CpaB [Rhodospirillales bacterium]|nr:Flp pilus assembly protein CpaB [Rhodospirillales bacterium]